MSRGYIKERKLSVFTYFFILTAIVLVTILVFKELGIREGLEEISYQKDIDVNVDQDNKYYIKKITY